MERIYLNLSLENERSGANLLNFITSQVFAAKLVWTDMDLNFHLTGVYRMLIIEVFKYTSAIFLFLILF